MNCSNKLESIEKITKEILAGNVVILPTETVYGIAVRYDRQDSVDKLFQLKKRDIQKPISLHISKHMLHNFNIPIQLNDLCDRLFPGPFTIIINSTKKYGFHSQSTYTGKIGIRVPENVIFQTIIEKVQIPLCMTSVNFTNQKSATKFHECMISAPGIEDDQNVCGKESIIIDTTSNPMYASRV